jgi:DNA-binding Lrp family transcriptional regulator
MDKTDLKIINILSNNCRTSNNSIGRSVGLNPKSVKARIDKLVEDGIIQEFILHINPIIFGFQKDHLLVLNEEDANSLSGNNKNRSHVSSLDIDQIIKRISMVEDLYLHVQLMHGSHTFLSAVRDGTDDKIPLLVDSLKPIVKMSRLLQRIPLAPSIKVKETDLKIIKTLMSDPKMNILDVAKRISLSTKTVARRLEKLNEDRIIGFSLLTDPLSMKGEGYIQFSIIIDIEKSTQKRVFEQIYHDFHEYFVYNPYVTPFEDIIQLRLCSIDMFTVDYITKQIKSYNGVKHVSLFFTTRQTYYKEWLPREINRRIETNSI